MLYNGEAHFFFSLSTPLLPPTRPPIHIKNANDAGVVGADMTAQR